MTIIDYWMYNILSCNIIITSFLLFISWSRSFTPLLLDQLFFLLFLNWHRLLRLHLTFLIDSWLKGFGGFLLLWFFLFFLLLVLFLLLIFRLLFLLLFFLLFFLLILLFILLNFISLISLSFLILFIQSFVSFD